MYMHPAHCRYWIAVVSVITLTTWVEAGDIPSELLVYLSSHTLQGNVVRPSRDMNHELKVWEKVMPTLSRGDADAIARPLARRVLATALPRLLNAEPDDLIVAWGRVIGPAILKEIANFQNGGDSVALNEVAVEKLRQTVIKSETARLTAASLRFQAETEEARFLTETVGPRIAKRAGVDPATQGQVSCSAGNSGNSAWITVRNNGEKQITNAVIGITLELPKGVIRSVAFYTPKLLAGETLRTQTTIGADYGIAPLMAKDGFQIEKVKLSVWCDQYVQKEQVANSPKVHEALKAFILSGFASGTSYRTKIEYFAPKPPAYVFTVNGVQSGNGIHRISAVLTNTDLKQQVTASAVIADKDFATLDLRKGQATIQFRTKTGSVFAMAYGLSGTSLGGSGGPFNPKEGMRQFEAKETIDAMDVMSATWQQTPEGKAQQLFFKASNLESQGQFEAAKKLFGELIEKYPKTPEADVARRIVKHLNERKK
jgi:hypothetical protein